MDKKTLQRPPKKGLFKNIFFYLILLLLGFSIFYTLSPTSRLGEEKPISEVLSLIKEDKVKRIEIEGNILNLELKGGEKFYSRKEGEASFLEILSRQGIDPLKVEEGIAIKESFPLGDLIINVAPILLMAFFFLFLFRQAKGASVDIFSFGKSRARLFSQGRQKKVTFDDAAGVDEAKQELREVVDFLKNPQKYRKLGARIPRGVLLVGPAGTGKTLLARAVANEAKVPFFSMAGSEFMEMLVGVGPSRVRDLFQTAKKNAPSLVFIDEIESIGRQRGFAITGGHEEREQTLNQILTEMDGFEPNTNLIILAATNRPDLLDPALTRPGRFDRRIVLALPDIKGREGILKIHMRGKPFAKDVDVSSLARRTVGFSGADIENMLNEAAILAARVGRKGIDNSDLEEAATKVKLGPERKRLQSEEERKMTAYHEAGHALVSANLPHMDPVHRVSIVARGLALGYTMIPPLIDRYNLTKTRLLEQITTLLGGRAAEELSFSEMTIGAGTDLEQASALARKMVTEFGMSNLGPLSFTQTGEDRLSGIFLGKVTYSEEMGGKIDREVKRIIDECYKRALEILKKNRAKLDLVAGALVKKETLEGGEFKSLIDLNGVSN